MRPGEGWSKLQRDLSALAEGPLGFHARDHSLARLLGRHEWPARLKGRHRPRELLPALEVPERRVEGVHGLLQDPGPDAVALVPPAAGAAAIRKAEQLEECVARLADLAGVDHRLDAPPLRGQPQLVADRQHAAGAPG